MPTINNPGNAPTDRWVLTLTATASQIRFINNTEDEPPFIVNGLGGGDAVVLYGENHILTRNGVPSVGLIQPGSSWPMIQPGANDISISGGTGTLRFWPVYA